jgi:bifunctional non-homologous end joining protein LigD
MRRTSPISLRGQENYRARRGCGLVFIAFDLLFFDSKDLRREPLEQRRSELRRLIPRSPKSCLQFSEEIAAEGDAVFASAERLGLEGIVSKGLGSHYRNGLAKGKMLDRERTCLIETELDKRTAAPIVLLARDEDDDGLRFAGGAFFALKAAHRNALRERVARLTADRSPIPALRKRAAQWIKPELVVGVRHRRVANRSATRRCTP